MPPLSHWLAVGSWSPAAAAMATRTLPAALYKALKRSKQCLTHNQVKMFNVCEDYYLLLFALLLKGFKGVRQLAYPYYIINTLKEKVLLISGIPDTLRTEEEPAVITLTHHWMSLLSHCAKKWEEQGRTRHTLSSSGVGTDLSQKE